MNTKFFAPMLTFALTALAIGPQQRAMAYQGVWRDPSTLSVESEVSMDSCQGRIWVLDPSAASSELAEFTADLTKTSSKVRVQTKQVTKSVAGGAALVGAYLVSLPYLPFTGIERMEDLDALDQEESSHPEFRPYPYCTSAQDVDFRKLKQFEMYVKQTQSFLEKAAHENRKVRLTEIGLEAETLPSDSRPAPIWRGNWY